MTSVAEQELNSPEIKIFGEYPQVPVDVQDLVMLSQVRSGLNPDLPELKESIRTKGLLNPIDVAVMAKPQLEAYIDFVNTLWGTEMMVGDFAPQERGGIYYVVIAGHTRTEAVKQLSDEDESGATYRMVVKLHDVSDPQEIIALQLDENIHSKPSQERRAMAIVEAYMYGLQAGQWQNEREFLETSGERFSKDILKEALGFARLPRDARDFVFAGKMSYAAGVAIGMATETILEYTTARLGYSEGLEDDEVETVEDTYRDTVSLLIAQISNRRLNSTAAKKFVKGRVDEMRRWLTAQATEAAADEQLGFSLVSPAEQAIAYQRVLDAEVRAAMREIANTPHQKAVELLSLHRRLSGKAHEEAFELLDRSIESGRRALGERTLRVTA